MLACILISGIDSFCNGKNRVYRQKMDMDYVLSELRKGSGTQFDPNIVKIMISLIEEGIIDPSKRYEGGEA